MLNSISAIGATEALYGTSRVSDKTQTDEKVAATASSVVDLQGTSTVASDRAASSIDSSQAQALALDIASLLGSHGGGVQENLNGFDAARLLAD